MNSITFCSKLYLFRYQWAKLGKDEKIKDKFEWKFNNRMKITNKYIIILHTSTADLFLKIEKKNISWYHNRKMAHFTSHEYFFIIQLVDIKLLTATYINSKNFFLLGLLSKTKLDSLCIEINFLNKVP